MGMSGIAGGDLRLVREQFQQFKSGKFNLQKTDLNDLKKALGTADSKASSGLDGLLASFDQIDTNQDGISFKELVDFTRAQGAAPAGGGGGSSAVEGNCAQCTGCGKCGKAGSVQDASMVQGSGQRGKHGGKHGSVFDLPPISVDDLNSYKDQLIKDGKEVPPELDELISSFDSIDGDKSGKISFQEVRDYLKKTAPQPETVSLSKDDLNNLQDKITKKGKDVPAELKDLIANFDSIDADKSGKINYDEVQAFLKLNAPQQENAALSKDDLTSLKDKIAQVSEKSAAKLDNLLSNFDSADSNGDGKIDLQELQKFLKANAKDSDSDSNSAVAAGASLNVRASMKHRSHRQASESDPTKPSPIFMQRLAAAYGQLSQPISTSSVQVQV